jgi:glutamate decarboxylase
MSEQSKQARATLENLERIFAVAQAEDSTLGRIDSEITKNLAGFLQANIVATNKSLAEIEKEFADPSIPEEPLFVSEQTRFLMDKVVAQSVHTASPNFIGHMTTALPNFMLPLSRIMIALNQNLVKTETSKAGTPLERQVLGMLHHLVYGRDEQFYQRWLHDSEHALGAFCSGGTIGNITALWVARNSMFGPTKGFAGIGQEGFYGALQHYGYSGAAIIVSRLGHYSLRKAADVLGIGRNNIIAVDVDAHNRIDVQAVREAAADLKARNIKLLAIVGTAGTTEVGTVDPLTELSQVANEHNAHFHVDAAWGGPTLFSDNHRHLLDGIELADSVALDAHKQLYVPLGAGMVVFRDPESPSSIEHHARYIIRPGSRDLGSNTLEGSRPGMSMLVHSALKIFGRRGYGILIDEGIAKAKLLAGMIAADPDFELMSEPKLNILTYRYVPDCVQAKLQTASDGEREEINEMLNALTRQVQVIQREAGKSFVSRTQLNLPLYHSQPVSVFRAVLANPLTTAEILESVLAEQKAIAETLTLQKELLDWHPRSTGKEAARA